MSPGKHVAVELANCIHICFLESGTYYICHHLYNYHILVPTFEKFMLVKGTTLSMCQSKRTE
jgi:hypothetical protein